MNSHWQAVSAAPPARSYWGIFSPTGERLKLCKTQAAAKGHLKRYASQYPAGCTIAQL
jgi:hypothetical protein